jgi:uncharacterized protein YhhL (DUF1145 family)
MEQRISRAIIIIMWISLPLMLLFHAPLKFVVFITVIWFFTLYSHICQAFIHRDLIGHQQPRLAVFKILVFGPIEIEHLKKLQQTSINTQ